MNDIVERLRAVAATHTQHFGIMREAADHIEALEAALREIAGWPSSCEEARDIARAALDKDEGK